MGGAVCRSSLAAGVLVPRWGGAVPSATAGGIAAAGRNPLIPWADRLTGAVGIALAESMHEFTKR